MFLRCTVTASGLNCVDCLYADTGELARREKLRMLARCTVLVVARKTEARQLAGARDSLAEEFMTCRLGAWRWALGRAAVEIAVGAAVSGRAHQNG